MKKSRRCVVLILTLLFAVFSLQCTGLAVFDKTELSGGLFQLNVVHTITMDSLDENVYTAWTSAVCFTAGRAEDGTLYFVTDASLQQPDRVYEALGEELLSYLQAGGIYIDASQLSSYAVITATDYYLAYSGAYVSLTPASQSASDQLLFLTLTDPSFELSTTTFTYAYADLLKEGETVYTFALSGAEIDGIVPATQDAYVTNWSLSTQEAQVQYPAAISDGSRAITYYTMEPSRGAQGSALFNGNGYLVGVNLWTNAYEGTTALTSSAVMAALDQLDVSYEVYESATGNFSFSDIKLYVIVLGAAILLIILLLIVVRIRKNKLDVDDVSDLEQEARRAREDMAQKSDTAARRAQTPAQPARENRSGGAAPAGTDVRRTAVPAAQRGRIPAASGQTPPARGAQSAAAASAKPAIPRSVSLTILGGKLKGMSIPVPEKVLIGRDPEACNVIFPADETAVSRHHCTVTFNRQTGRVLLEDVSSANGTYFPSGTRVIPGRLYSLRNGDRFYLGLQDNMMEVRIEYAQN